MRGNGIKACFEEILTIIPLSDHQIVADYDIYVNGDYAEMSAIIISSTFQFKIFKYIIKSSNLQL